MISQRPKEVPSIGEEKPSDSGRRNHKIKKVFYVTYYSLVLRVVADEEKDAGIYPYRWDGKDDSENLVGSGLYFVHIQAGDYKKTEKIVVVK